MKISEQHIKKFWSLVNKTDSCWLWMGNKRPDGYGRLSLAKYRREYAHRISYCLTKGEIPKGLVLDHLCRNTSCVNPNHLEAVTDKVNILRGESPAARQARQTHCIHGHELSGKNLAVHGGKRKCKTCRNESVKRFYWKNKEKSCVSH